MLPPEIWILAVVLAGITFVAVPAIVRGSFLPRDLEVEVVPDEALSESQHRYFQRLDAHLAALGYSPVSNFVATNLQGDNLTRYYRSDHDPAILGASCLRGVNFVDENARGAVNYGEWITKYEDGSSLNTLNSPVSDLFDLMPHQIRQRFPGLTDLAQLKGRHDRKAALLLPRHPRFAHGRDIVAEWETFHRDWCEFQASRGLLRHEPEAGGYRVAPRAAWRGVLNFLNPLADNFSLPRFLAGVVLGAGLPIVTLLLLRDPAVLTFLSNRFGSASAFLPLGLSLVAFALAGAVVGWVFEGKCFVWSLVLGYVPLRIVGSALGMGIVLCLVMGFVADRVSWIRSRRNALV
jgi:hypothetical protein